MSGIRVMVTLLGAPKGVFVVSGHAPTMIRPTYQTRGELMEDGRVFIPADSPIPSYYVNPNNVIKVELLIV